MKRARFLLYRQSKRKFVTLLVKGIQVLALFLLVVTSVSLAVGKYSLEGSISKAILTTTTEDVFLATEAHGAWTGVPALITEKNTSTIFWYKNDRVSDDTGKPLVLLDLYKKKFDWPPEDYVTLSKDTGVSRGHVFVTGSTLNYYRQMLSTISSIQQFSPGVKIIVWDFGWKGKEFITYIKSLCDVEYRRFDFSAYPSHVRSLKNYAFKPLVIAETLKDYPRLVYMDSSIRFISTGNFSHIKPQLLQTGGILQMLKTHHSIYVATHEELYQYFPCDLNKTKYTDMGGAGFLVVYRTERVFKNILLFWVLCALEQNCIEPIKELICDTMKFKRGEFADCHRFDQSTISILLANHYNYNFTLYRDYMAKGDKGDFVRVERGTYENNPLIQCFTNNTAGNFTRNLFYFIFFIHFVII